MRSGSRVAWLAAPLAALLAVFHGCEDDDSAGGSSGGSGGAGGSIGVGGDVTNALDDAQLGDPLLQSIQRLSFGPGGVLLLGDGARDTIVALETGDTDPSTRANNTFDALKDVSDRIASALGDGIDGDHVTIHDIAVNPISWRTYLAATNNADGRAALCWIGGDGEAHEVDMSNVLYAAVEMPVFDTPAAAVAGIEWAGRYVVVAREQSDLWAGQLAIIETPFTHEGSAEITTTRIYDRNDQLWRDAFLIQGLFAYRHDGDDYIAAANMGAVARFRVDDIATGVALAPGVTAFDYGFRLVQDFVSYQSDGQTYLVASMYHLSTPGTVAAARVKLELLTQSTDVNEQAPVLFGPEGETLHPDADRLPILDGAERLATLGDDRVVVLRADTLSTVELP